MRAGSIEFKNKALLALAAVVCVLFLVWYGGGGGGGGGGAGGAGGGGGGGGNKDNVAESSSSSIDWKKIDFLESALPEDVKTYLRDSGDAITVETDTKRVEVRERTLYLTCHVVKLFNFARLGGEHYWQSQVSFHVGSNLSPCVVAGSGGVPPQVLPRLSPPFFRQDAVAVARGRLHLGDVDQGREDRADALRAGTQSRRRRLAQ